MAKLNFHASKPFTMGIELELQLINPQTQTLVAKAKDLIRKIQNSKYSSNIKPEVTQGMIELNSNIHQSPDTLFEDLVNLTDFLAKEVKSLNVEICGGGTHPFQIWTEHKIFPSPRFRRLAWRYRYLSKRYTVFGLHLHIGCLTGDDAIYLTHSLSRFVPHLIALSASSPFYHGIDTGFHSARANVVNAFPSSGHIPFLLNWREFADYYLKMRKLKVVQSMKDFYWDIRPKPTFGTIELRVCDTPLTVERTVLLAAYVQILAHYLLKEKPYLYSEDLYHLYNYNRFEACRYGFDGLIVDPFTYKHIHIQDDILKLIPLLKPHAQLLKSKNYLKKIQMLAETKQNDATWLHNVYHQTHDFKTVIKRQCQLWRK